MKASWLCPPLTCTPVFRAPLAGDSSDSERTSKQRLLLGTHERLAAEWKRILGLIFSNPSLCGSPVTQRFPWGLCCFQEHQALRAPPGLSILTWQSWAGTPVRELNKAPCG